MADKLCRMCGQPLPAPPRRPGSDRFGCAVCGGDRGGDRAAATHDAQLVALWLQGRPEATRRAYARDVVRFLGVVGKPPPTVALGDLHAYADGLADLAPSTRARYLSAVKSLLAFGHRIGYPPVDVGALVKLPALKNTLAERILGEPTTQRILALEPDRRNRAILRLLYAGGLRRSELVGLRWRDLRPRDASGQRGAREGGGVAAGRARSHRGGRRPRAGHEQRAQRVGAPALADRPGRLRPRPLAVHDAAFGFFADQWVGVVAEYALPDGSQASLWTEGDTFTLALGRTVERLMEKAAAHDAAHPGARPVDDDAAAP